MWDFLANYGLFLAKAITVVAGILVVIAVASAIKHRHHKHHGELEITDLNEDFDDLEESLAVYVMDKHELKQHHKEKKQKEKSEKKTKKQTQKKGKKSKKDQEDEDEQKPNVYVLEFDGDVDATEIETLRKAITAILTLATPNDEVVLKLESAGGYVHSYGLAASQLERIRQAGIPLTVAIDKVAASGGYLMACVADKILAAPFAIIGSIGVIGELPNVNRLLDKNGIDYESHTAGEFKRTLTVLGKNTDKARKKFIDELEETHSLFKDHIAEHRPKVKLDKVATGEHWYGTDALKLKLIDEITTSDDYLLGMREDAQIFEVNYAEKQSLKDKMSELIQESTYNSLSKLIDKYLIRSGFHKS